MPRKLSDRMTLAVALIMVASAFQGAYALPTNPSNSINLAEGNNATNQFDYFVSRHSGGGGGGHGNGGGTTTNSAAQGHSGGGNNTSTSDASWIPRKNNMAAVAVSALLGFANMP